MPKACQKHAKSMKKPPSEVPPATPSHPTWLHRRAPLLMAAGVQHGRSAGHDGLAAAVDRLRAALGAHGGAAAPRCARQAGGAAEHVAHKLHGA